MICVCGIEKVQWLVSFFNTGGKWDHGCRDQRVLTPRHSFFSWRISTKRKNCLTDNTFYCRTVYQYHNWMKQSRTSFFVTRKQEVFVRNFVPVVRYFFKILLPDPRIKKWNLRMEMTLVKFLHSILKATEKKSRIQSQIRYPVVWIRGSGSVSQSWDTAANPVYFLHFLWTGQLGIPYR